MQYRNLEFCKEKTEHVLNKLLLRKFQNTDYFIAFLYSVCRALFSASSETQGQIAGERESLNDGTTKSKKR